MKLIEFARQNKSFKLIFIVNLFSLLINFKFYGVYFSFFVNGIFSLVGFISFAAEESLKRSTKVKLLIALFIIIFINCILAFNGHYLYMDNFIHGWLKNIILVFIGFYTYQELLKDKSLQLLDWIYHSFIVFIVFSCCKYIWQNLEIISIIDSNLNRPDPEWIGGANQFASIISLGFFVLISTPRPRITKHHKLILSCFFIFTLVTTMSRGGFYALAITFFIYALGKGVRFLFLTMTSMTVVYALIELTFKSATLWQNLKNRYFFASPEGSLVEKTSGRNEIWGYLINEASDSPAIKIVFGHGVGTFQFDSYLDPHNSYLQVFWEFGLIGLAAVMIALIYLYRPLLKRGYLMKPVDTEALCLIILSLNMIVEGYHYSTQTGWILGFFIGIFFYKRIGQAH